MIRLGTILIVDSDRSASEALGGRLARNAYHVIHAQGGEDVAAIIAGDRPDAILVGRPFGGEGLDLAAGLKAEPATDDIPVLLLVDDVTATNALEAIDKGLDDIVAIGSDDNELLARLRPLIRVSVMQSELRHRAHIAAGFGVKARDRVTLTAGTPSAVLIIGDRGAEIAEMLKNDCGCEMARAEGLYEAETMLTTRNFDAAVLAFAEMPEDLLGFCTQVRNNPRLFNLPMVLLAGPEFSAAEAYRRGASRVLADPPDAGVLRSAVLTLVRRQQRRWAIRQAMFDSLAPATREAETGLYDAPFLKAYLEARLAAAKASHRHLSLVFFSVPNVESVRHQFGDDAALHLSQQLGQWITGLLRAEDLTARHQSNEFCVVLPDTPLGEAEVVMHRIAGVLSYTDFAVRDVYQPVKVWVEVSCTDSKPDDDLASFVWRARRNLD